jgi:glycosyltransferase involved in cell wall biosynthesis
MPVNSVDNERGKFLEIGNYPPPMCGWAIQTVLVTSELRRRGHICEVLKINEGRQQPSQHYIDVQNGWDYVYKVLRFVARGYVVHMHVNAEAPKGYILALLALVACRLFGGRSVLTFHGGLPQTYFPKRRPRHVRWAFQLLFRLANRLTCDNEEMKAAIIGYGIAADRIAAVPCFSAELLQFQPTALPQEISSFIASGGPTFLCYVSYRPEYCLPALRRGMALFRCRCPEARFLWLGFPEKELPAAEQFIGQWEPEERQGVLLLGNLSHDLFLTLLTRCFALVRTPACDGVSACVLESLALGIPVVASENGRRPAGVLTFKEGNAEDLCSKLEFLTDHYESIKPALDRGPQPNNTSRVADWLIETGMSSISRERSLHATQ